jgi:hypothetical protein
MRLHDITVRYQGLYDTVQPKIEVNSYDDGL